MQKEINEGEFKKLVDAMSKRFAERILKAQEIDFHFSASQIENAFNELKEDIDEAKKEIGHTIFSGSNEELRQVLQKWFGKFT